MKAGNRCLTGIALMRSDGSDVRIIPSDQSIDSPIFSPDGLSIFFVQDADGDFLLSGDTDGEQALWRFDINDEQVTKVAEIPESWSTRTERWTEEGYLMLLASSEDAVSVNNTTILLDVSNGGVVYATDATDFTRFLGFVE